MRQIASRLYLTVHWGLTVACGAAALMFCVESDASREPWLHVVALPLFFAPVLALWLLRRWWSWLIGDPVIPAPKATPRPPPAKNWTPPEQEEAGPNTSAWVEEKLRQAKRN